MKPRSIAASDSIGSIALLLLLALTSAPVAGHSRGFTFGGPGGE